MSMVSKITEKDEQLMLEWRRNGHTYKEIGKHFGYSDETIRKRIISLMGPNELVGDLRTKNSTGTIKCENKPQKNVGGIKVTEFKKRIDKFVLMGDSGTMYKYYPDKDEFAIIGPDGVDNFMVNAIVKTADFGKFVTELENVFLEIADKFELGLD